MDTTKTKTKENEPNEYMEYCLRKRQINEERLKELGLSEGMGLKKKVLANKKRTDKKMTIRTGLVTRSGTRSGTRRSSRVSGVKKPELFGIEYLDEKVAFQKKLRRRNEEKQSSTNNLTVVRRRNVSLSNAMTTEECQKFQHVSSEEFLDDMEQYYLKIVGNSATNVARVICQVRKLVSGQGIVHPATNNVFRKGTEILLNTNFRELLDEGSEWVYENGGDRGNGWLVEHPIKKCFVYQHARDENKKAFFFDTKP